MFDWCSYLIIIRWKPWLLLFIFSFISDSFIPCFQNFRWLCLLQYRCWFILNILTFHTHSSISNCYMSWWQTRWFEGLLKHTIVLIVLHHEIWFNSWMSIWINHIWFVEVVYAFGQGRAWIDAATNYVSATSTSVRHLTWEYRIIDFFKFYEVDR